MKLSEVTSELTRYLAGAGVHAAEGWRSEERLRHTAPVVTITLQGLENCCAGLGDYLGQALDSETALLREVRGKELKLSLGLNFYSPKGQPDGPARLFSQIAEVLAAGGPDGLVIQSITCGPVSYDKTAGMLVSSGALTCRAWMYAVSDEDGVPVSEIIVKGVPVI